MVIRSEHSQRVRVLQLSLDTEGWFDEPKAEDETKPQGQRSTIGFV